ncbi:MAG: PilZ domain-containing protein [Myxococcaceae bacterium]
MPDGWKGEVVDLSATGLRIQCLALLTPQSVIEGTLVIDEKTSIRLKGVVVWTSPPDHRGFVPAEFGLELTEVPEVYLRALARLFAEQG